MHRLGQHLGLGGALGGGQGHGRATAKRFAQEGAKLMLVDRHAPGAERVRDELVDFGAEADIFVAEIRSRFRALTAGSRAASVPSSFNLIAMARSRRAFVAAGVEQLALTFSEMRCR